MLAAEVQRVVSLRLAAIAGGGPAADLETRLMVTEKMNAALEAAAMLARGASTRSVISFYRSRVQANVRRLTRKPPLHGAKQKLLNSLEAFRM
jgi:succinylarginine dihydrolase